MSNGQSTDWKEFLEAFEETWKRVGSQSWWRFGNTDMKTSDEGPDALRPHLPPQYQHFSNTEMRRAFVQLDRSHRSAGGKNAKKNKGGPRSLCRTLRDAGNKLGVAKNLSPEYLEYRESFIWKDRAQEHRNWTEWHCQICGREHGHASTLHVHHNRYGALDGKEPAQWLIAVCAEPCHLAADACRKYQSNESVHSSQASADLI